MCALERIKKHKSNSQDIIFADIPYALGSTVYIDPKDGKPKYKKAKDFMEKWDMPDHNFWEEFFKECNRVLKHGGRVMFFGVDRQLMLFNYYAVFAGLETQQSLYWYFLENFPKSVSISKQLDKKQEAHELSDVYDGYKYSVAPLKQVLETVMVFRKAIKTKSEIDDFIQFSNGDKSISPTLWNISGNRVPAKDEEYANSGRDSHTINSKKTFNFGLTASISKPNENGRYPSQLFCCTESANRLDQQSGILKSGGMKKGMLRNMKEVNTFNAYTAHTVTNEVKKSQGGCSKILHTIDYNDEELEYLIYDSKVSNFERYAGADNNDHPTLKPIKLIYKIAKLLKTPHPQNIFFPFAGAGSEIIGFEQAGYDTSLFTASEISDKNVKIANKRISFWKKFDINDIDKAKKHLKVMNNSMHGKGVDLFNYNSSEMVL